MYLVESCKLLTFIFKNKVILALGILVLSDKSISLVDDEISDQFVRDSCACTGPVVRDDTRGPRGTKCCPLIFNGNCCVQPIPKKAYITYDKTEDDVRKACRCAGPVFEDTSDPETYPKGKMCCKIKVRERNGTDFFGKCCLLPSEPKKYGSCNDCVTWTGKFCCKTRTGSNCCEYPAMSHMWSEPKGGHLATAKRGCASNSDCPGSQNYCVEMVGKMAESLGWHKKNCLAHKENSIIVNEKRITKEKTCKFSCENIPDFDFNGKGSCKKVKNCKRHAYGHIQKTQTGDYNCDYCHCECNAS